MDPQLLDYISKARVAGLDDSQIRQNLISIGWSEIDVDHALRDSQQAAPTPAPVAVTSAMGVITTPEVVLSTTKAPRFKVYSKIIGVAVAVILLLGGGYFGYAQGLPMLALSQFTKNPTASVSNQYNHFEIALNGTDLTEGREQTYGFQMRGDTDYSNPENPMAQFFVSLNAKFLEQETSFKDIEGRKIGKKQFINISQVPFIGDTAKDYNGWVEFDLSELQKNVTQNESEFNGEQAFQNLDFSKLVTDYSFVGRESVSGVATYHYRLEINKAALPEIATQVAKNVGSSDADIKEMQTTIEESLKDVAIDKFEIWIGSKDKQLHKILLGITTVDNPKSGDPSVPGGLLPVTEGSSQAVPGRSELSFILTPGGPLNLKAPEKALDFKKIISGEVAPVIDFESGSQDVEPFVGEARLSSYNAKAMAQIKQISFALELYFRDFSRFPDNLNELLPNYLTVIPEFVKLEYPACKDLSGYNYAPTDGGKNYVMYFCLSTEMGGFAPGLKTVRGPIGVIN